MIRFTTLARIFNVFALAFLMTGYLSVAPARSADLLELSGREENGFGRLVFTWPDTGLPSLPSQVDERLPDHETSVSAGVLVVSFDRPFELDAEDLLRRMPRYLALIRQDRDGKTMRLAMKAEFTFHVKEAGHELYVDLLPPNWTGDPPPLPQAALDRLAAEQAERDRLAQLFDEQGPEPLDIEDDGPTLALRVGQQPAFTRLGFEWDRPVLYSTAFRDDRITITFDKNAEIDLAPIRVDPPRFVKSARSIASEGRLTVFIETIPGMRVRDFREDLSIVLDVSPIDPAAAPVAAAPPTPLLPGPDPVVPDSATARAIEAQIAAANEAAGVEAPAHADQPDTASDLTDAAEAPAQEADAAEEDTAAPVDTGPEVALLPERRSSEDQDRNLPVYSERIGDSVRLTFPWHQETNAAVFQREGRVWILFDRQTQFELDMIGPAIREKVGDPQLLSLERASVLMFTPPSRVLLSASEKDNQWIVTLGDVIVEPTRPVTVTRGWAASGEPRVAFDLDRASQVHWVRDPVVQDVLAVVTADGPAQGLLTPRRFVEFEALPSAQGLAFVSRADDLYVSLANADVTVSRGSGLTLSAADGPSYSGAGSRTSGGQVLQLDFERWRYAPGNTFTERKQNLQAAVANAAPGEMTRARLQYAKFLLSYRLGPEAFTMLRAAEAESEMLALDPNFRLLRGIALVMMNRYDMAQSDLTMPALADDPHAALWRAVAHAEQGEWVAARASFEQAEQAFAFYTSDLQTLFRVKAAEAALAASDFGNVEFNLDRIPEDAPPSRWLSQGELARAGLFEALGRQDQALEIYDALIAEEERPIAARARFANASLRHEMGLLDDAGLIDELEALQYMWRGDDLELAVLEKLGSMKIAHGDVADGLTILRTAVGHYPETDRGRRIASQMTDVFTDLFLGGAADELEAVEALTIYYNFRELTPIGRRGDALIRKLADRLVEVDLLDKAADLLSHQVENRLRGTARAQVAAKLALIQLMDHKPQEALQAIRSTRQVRLPDDLTRRRRLLEARALVDLGLFDHALDLMSEMEGSDVESFRADVYWESQQWADASGLFESALGERWRDPLALSDQERFDVMRMVIGYSLADDAVGVERVRSKYGALMRDGPDAASFAIVTDPIQTDGLAFRELARSVASVGTLDRFVESMRGDWSELEADDDLTTSSIN